MKRQVGRGALTPFCNTMKMLRKYITRILIGQGILRMLTTFMGRVMIELEAPF
jgi:hypothetical protein